MAVPRKQTAAGRDNDRLGSDTRRRVVDAAAQVLKERGLSGTTTKEISRAAGLSEGTLYNYFSDKLDLLLAVLQDLLPRFQSVSGLLTDRAGKATVEENLRLVTRAALAFYRDLVPYGTAVVAEPELLQRLRVVLVKQSMGPQRAYEPLAAYLDEERELGRVRSDVDPLAAAQLLYGACFQQSFIDVMSPAPETKAKAERRAADLVRQLMRGLAP